MIFCSHNLKENTQMDIPFRSGNRLIEYSPEAVNSINDRVMQDLLTLEIFRIALKHPYLPLCPLKQDSYKKSTSICAKMFSISDEAKKTRLNITAGSELWKEDSLESEEINQIIEKTQTSNLWGTISSNEQLIITAKTLPKKLDFKSIVQNFKSSLRSGTKELTRMKPNRRYGFSAMGSRKIMYPNLLIAIDASGSINPDNLNTFLSMTNNFFSRGLDKVDVVYFDTIIKGNVISLKNAIKTMEIHGGGGTNYQSVINYISIHKEYDGLIIFTDGFAPIPKIDKNIHTKIMFIFTDEEKYSLNKIWLSKLPQCMATFIPN